MGFLTEYANKSGLQKHQTGPKVSPGGSYGNPSLSSRASISRLVEAFRSQSPGGWSDDRWEQSKHLTGITYICGHRICEQMSQAEFQVFIRDPSHPQGKREVTEKDKSQSRKLADLDIKPWDLVRLLEHPNEEDSFGDLMYCFPAGTRVRMADGSNKSIENVRLLDEVLTAEGNIKKVRQCHARKYDGDLITMKLWGHKHLKLTPNHKVLTKNGYVEASNLAKSDWVALPRYCPEKSTILQTASHIAGKKTITKSWYSEKSYGRVSKIVDSTNDTPWANFNKIPDFIKMTPGFGRILGLYLAEGHAEKYSVIWSFGSHEKDTLVADLVSLLRDELGIEARIQVRNKWKSVTQVVVNGVLWVRLFKSLCGIGAGGKRIHSDLMSGSDQFLESMFHGWIDGDGCVTKGGLSGATISHDLALNMFDIANHLGKRPVIGKSDPRKPPKKMSPSGIRVVSKHPIWRVCLNSVTDNYRVEQKDKVVWRRVCGIERSHYTGDVFNIGVEDDNSYVAEGIGTHNCWGQQLLLTGMGLTWMLPNELGTPMQLFSIPTAIAIPQPTINPEFPHGFYRIQPVYPYGPFSSYPTPASAVGAPIPAQWMLKFKFPHPFLHYDGYSPLTALRLHIDEVEMVDRSRFYSMKRSVHPSAVLNFDEVEGQQPLPEPEIARIHAEWENEFQGPENHGKIVVGTPGGKIEPWGSSPVDMEYASGWEQLTSFVMAGLGITKPVAGMIDGSSYSTLFAALKQFHLLTLKPMLDRIASKLTRQLGKFFGDSLIIEIRCPRIDDHELKRSNVSVLAQYKALTLGEMREALDFPRTGEEWENERAGEEPQQQGMPGMPGMDPNAMQPGMDPNAMMQQAPPEPGQENIDDVLGWSPGGGQEQQAQPQQPQPAAAQAQPQTQPAQAKPQPKGAIDDILNWSPEGEDGEEVDPSEASRPSTGGLGAGALGPRKSLQHNRMTHLRVKKKSIYQQIREAIHVNGQT